ncbi:MAG: asparaginase [Parcubacteria group bacterium]|nr:asparaginase [Parcubacteria group bacterium]
MDQRVHIILPQMPGYFAEALRLWLTALPELGLLAKVEVHIVEWEQKVSGSTRDWVEMAKKVTERLPRASGILVWAPEQSLLELAGTISLALPAPGKPVICFAAEWPDLTRPDNIQLMALKSVLINAVFTSLADVGEVLVLHGSQLFKPSTCQWTVHENTLAVASSEPAVAVIDSSLRLQGQYRRRTEEGTSPTWNDFVLSPDVYARTWLPSLPQPAEWQELPAARALVVSTEAHYWQHPDLQKLRQRWQERDLPIIWHSRFLWDVTLSNQEIAVTHSQAWWVVLAAQAAFGKHRQSDEALNYFRTMLPPV